MSAQALRSSSALQLMNSTMSGWSAFSTTILAARRVLPPDLITPAEASAARMNDTGPEAVPPPPRRSLDERKRERFTPDPEPDRKSTRLNSSHLGISYAVFCLKKKKKRRR